MPKRWFKGAPKHTHKAIDDAIGQGVLFVNMMSDDGSGRISEHPNYGLNPGGRSQIEMLLE